MVFDKAGFETWGRTFEFVFVVSTGNDEAAQLADAASVIAQQPFAVIVPLPTPTTGVGGPAFEREVASRKIVVVGYPSTKEALAQEPYRWSTAVGDDWAQMYLTAEFVGKQLAGRPATHAGEPALRASERVFGVLYPTGATGLDIRRFRRALDKFAGEPTARCGDRLRSRRWRTRAPRSSTRTCCRGSSRNCASRASRR